MRISDRTTSAAHTGAFRVQMTEDDERFIEGVWAIFGTVAGIGEALPTWRGQNEQTMAHAAMAYAKTKRRRRAHATTEVQPEIDFVAHAASMGARAEKATDIRHRGKDRRSPRPRHPSVIVIDTEAVSGTGAGGYWWDVAVPQIGGPERLEKARERYEANSALHRVFDWGQSARRRSGDWPALTPLDQDDIR